MELNDGIQEQKMDLLSSWRVCIPHFLPSLGQHQSAEQVLSPDMYQRDVGHAPEESPSIITCAKLSGHTMMFLTGTKVEIIGVSNQQWLRSEEANARTSKKGRTQRR
jgi:hypothetical protein